MKRITVTKTSDGDFSVRLRCGKVQGKPQILRFAIALRDEAAARARAERMQDFARKMVAAGLADKLVKGVSVTPQMLRLAGLESDADKFDVIAEAIDDMCAQRSDAKPQVKMPTVAEFGKAWTDGELHKRWPDQIPLKETSKDDASRLRNYVNPVIGSKRVDEVTLDDLEEVMRRVPESAARSRRHIAGTIARVFRMAVYPCRHIAASPLPKGFLPRANSRKAYAYLYPAEDAKLMACTAPLADGHPAVPYEYRLLWGFLSREGMREGEALALTWECIDLEHGMVRLDANKTDDPRSWALDPGVARAMALHRKHYAPAAKGTDRVLIQRSKFGLAETLREHLRRAGVKRAELFTSNATRQQMRVHDLRGTFVTLSLAAGKSERWVMARTGHTTSTMISRYHRTAMSFAELNLGELRPLDEAIPELAQIRKAATGDPQVIQSRPNPRKIQASPTGFEPVLQP